MQQLRRVGWQIGQPLLPAHLVALEDSMLAHVHFYMSNQGIPYYGVASLKWDVDLIRKGKISINEFSGIFPSGEVISVPENAQIIAPFDLNKIGKSKVTIYLHLLKSKKNLETYIDGSDDEENIRFDMYTLELSDESLLSRTKDSIRLLQFEKDVQNQWVLSDAFCPSLLNINNHPFLENTLFTIRSMIHNFQKGQEQEKQTGKVFEQRTMKTRLCLIEVAKFQRLLNNIEKNVITHPFFLYKQMAEFLDSLSIIYLDQIVTQSEPYDHGNIAKLFQLQIKRLGEYMKSQAEELSFVKFEKKGNQYVSERLPQEVHDAKDIYLITQPIDLNLELKLENLKLASYSRLEKISRYSEKGTSIVEIDTLPFNHNFSKFTTFYRIGKDAEWEFILEEGRAAFNYENKKYEVQGFLCWN